MRLSLPSVFVVLVTLFGWAQAKSAVGDRVLVVQEDESHKEQYSKFWSDLESRDFKLTFESPKNEKLSLFEHGELSYEHLILLPPKSKGYGPALTPQILLSYTNAGGNVLLALSSELGTPSGISSLLLEVDISLPTDRNSIIIDHFNYDSSSASEKHDVLLLPRPGPLRPDVMNFFGGDGLLALPNAVGQTLGNASPLLAPILKAPETAYPYNPKDEDPESSEDLFATGSQISLVSAMQARNNARFTVLGSLDMLQDTWFDASVKTKDGKSSKTANREFAKQLTEWAFKEVGVLKVQSVTHALVDDANKPLANTTQIGFQNPEIYRIKNDVTFSISLSLYHQTHYLPFNPPSSDSLQLEFTMLSPFHRLPLLPSPSQPSPNATEFTTTFTTPDQHGIFAFKVNYKRPFLTNVEEKRQVTVRHFAHDEWPRSFVISGAIPWVTGLWSVIAGFVLLVVGWLYCSPPDLDRRKARL